MYQVLKAIHVFAVIIFMGNIITGLFWKMHADGTYTKVSNDPDGFSSHEYFMTHPSLSGRGSALRRTKWQPVAVNLGP